MKLTESQLKQIILEEFEAVLSEADKDPGRIKTRINSYLDHVLEKNPNLQYGGIAFSKDPDCGPVLGPHDFVVRLTQRETKAESVEAVLAEISPEQDAPGLKGHSEREANREASCKAWKAQGKSLPDWCDDYI